MKRMVWLLMASALALAAPATQGKIMVSATFPPKVLPPGTVLLLEDAQGKALWESGKGMTPGAEALDKAAYVVFKLPKATYRYPVVQKGMALEELQVKVGKRVYALGTLLKNRNVAVGKDGSLVHLKAASPAMPKPTSKKP
ncbi:hypothetical protein [Thermus thermophilus]|uniref:hypothetical protein n=1 Tax=Thermus thermophilus TaxID=274 RepID=UPI001FCBA6F7|nr:hypothetical protein [Thermus thermophilus]BDG25326.1 hypothetical protein TthSNM33_25200 [Thermus thermophilus]